MNVLIVDDQYDDKVKSIAKKLKSLGIEKVNHKYTTRDAYDALVDSKFDLLILDLQIPESFGEDVDINGGVQLLDLISSDSSIDMPSVIVGITNHKDSYEDNIHKFVEKGWTLHLFDGETDFINSIIENSFRHSKVEQKYDVAFITALRHTEFDALLSNGMNWADLPLDDCNKYYTAKFNDMNGVERTAVATYCPAMGMPVSASIAMKVINKFNPKLLIMTGIAAGVEGKANLGDVLIPNQIWDWGNGKITDSDNGTALLFDPETITINGQLASEMSDIAAKGMYVETIKREFQGNPPAHSLAIKVGPIASGAAVLADSKTIDLIKEQKRSVIGVDMEAYGVLVASKLCGAEPIKTLIIKSVCDFANADKNDNWQKYSAYTSTMVATKIIENHIIFDK
ncbi:hypothetical protein [Vibrio fluvialis]|uniref:phosphorylase family protein n=1 Tax=Vibrio fluvialis TaxID=676 RepID=UPI00192BD340|nr:hypothetical protein [Vibrio fluvialis]MBL4238629.1 hypothetical protein [Vibrio fluvialis]MBL4264269.1 hypothetical protein [Vibrio fluvialis]MBL4269301.1 hypothetical protein [Vibrio fluvialis]MBL4273611.1 hypothetical protein [Vibrio fluvialis]MBO1439124.1 hypothetical protein [Vibrio fluvialis]